MDDHNQSMQQPQSDGSMNPPAPAGGSADPMAAPAMPTIPPMPTPDMTGAPAGGPADPMAAPAMPTAPAGGMDGMAGMTPPPPPPPPPAVPAMDPMGMGVSAPMPAAPMSVPPPAAGPATMDDIMAELRKIEDKLVEMDEKL